MKLSRDMSSFRVESPEPWQTIKNDLIQQIVARMNLKTDEERRDLEKRLAIAANALNWKLIDLHALLKKADDPTIRNFTAFVVWSCKLRSDPS